MRFLGRERTVVAEAREGGVVTCIVKVDEDIAEMVYSGVQETHEGGVKSS